MEMVLILALTTLGGIVFYAITQASVRASGVSLSQKFVSLGDLRGKTLDEIVSVVGEPNSTTALGNGQSLVQWQATGYLIALLFDENNICLGISSNISV